MGKQYVLAMYDIRGIQKYIYRTAKVKDTIGASAIVENIIEDALKEAAACVKRREEVSAELEWCMESGALEYREGDFDIQTLFIGGGNAFVMYSSRELCVKVNKLMARYILEHTYSLQLAVAIVDKTDSYAEDYQKLYTEMNRTKADMVVSRPLGTLPVMQMEVKTGYPLVSEDGSTETGIKKARALEKMEDEKQKKIERIFDNYITKKGTDSTLAVVHIDGNNMGLRIRSCLEGIGDYTKAVNTMRNISYHINDSYKRVFQQMQELFNSRAGGIKDFEDKKVPCFVRKILVAGDDITYVCNAKIAVATVEYYCREIAKYTMTGETTPEARERLGFSVCAGIAYIGSHFPFSIGYDVAESCCDSAKDRAKSHKAAVSDGTEITGNFMDFHICKNVQARDFDGMREQEYRTASGENLLLRPYYIRTDYDGKLSVLDNERFALKNLKNAIGYFNSKDNDEEKNLPRSFAKDIRNTYSLGEGQIRVLNSFLKSRGWRMPDGTDDFYYEENREKTAKWYDALELMDLYIDLDAFTKEGE